MSDSLFESEFEAMNQRLANLERGQKQLRLMMKILVRGLVNANEVKYGEMKQVLEQL